MGNKVPGVFLALAFIGAAGFNAVPMAASDISPYEAGARALGLGGAFAARADDPTALFYNPAGLAFQKGLRLKTNFFFGQPGVTAAWPPTGVIYESNPNQFRGSFAASWQFLNRMTLGLGFFMPYHFSEKWPFSWAGKNIASKAALNSFFIRPAISIELLKGLALGAGLDFVSAKAFWYHARPFNLKNYPLPQDVAVESTHDLKGTGMGFTAGLLWKALPSLQVGVRYQHHVPIDFSGRNNYYVPYLDIGNITVPDPTASRRYLYDLIYLFYDFQSVKSRITFPKEIVWGVLFAPSSRLSFQLDLQWNGWSEMGAWEFRSVNPDEKLSPAFSPLYQEFYGIVPDYGYQSAGIALRDSWRFKGGIEYQPARGFALRAGFARQQGSTAAADLNPLHPDPDRNVISLGFGYQGPFFALGTDTELGQISFDMFFRYGFSKKETSELPGYPMVYQAKPWNIGVGVGVNF